MTISLLLSGCGPCGWPVSEFEANFGAGGSIQEKKEAGTRKLSHFSFKIMMVI